MFTERRVNADSMHHFLCCSVEAPSDFLWDVNVDAVVAAIVRSSDSRLGPDGIQYVARPLPRIL